MNKKIILLICAFFLFACSDEEVIEKKSFNVDISEHSNNQNERIQFLIMHYTAINDEESLYVLTKGATSSHYLVPLSPKRLKNKLTALQLVPEDKRAWHAGESFWKGRTNLNDTSIGIEIVNFGFTEYEDKIVLYSYPDEQIDLIAKLAKDIIQRHNIPPTHILGHSDIAPQRKYDPGPLFPWKKLAKLGVGAWFDDKTVEKYLAGRDPFEEIDVKNIQTLLSKYGYEVPTSGILDEETKKVIVAFQLHFRPKNVTGIPDAQTESILYALLEKYPE